MNNLKYEFTLSKANNIELYTQIIFNLELNKF